MTHKIAMVAEGGRDIGAACVIELASKGAAVLITYQASKDTAESTVQETSANGDKALAVQADLTSEVDVERTVQTALSEFGGIDYLVQVFGGLVERRKLTGMGLTH